MALFTRFGDKLELVRLATIEDVKTFERRRADKQDKERTRDGWRAIARYSDASNGEESEGKETLVDAAYLRATEGWAEISDAFEALRKEPVAS